MKVFISQPMNGKTNQQIKEEREQLVEEIKSVGDEVIDSIFKEEPPLDVKNKGIYYLGKSLIEMSRADGVIFMKGWEEARGCKIEFSVAKEYDQFIKFWEVG